MKVKIKNVKNYKFSLDPIKLTVKVKSNGETTYGEMTISYLEGKIAVDLGRELTRSERLDVLKEIFNRLLSKQDDWSDMLSLRLVDLQKEEEYNTLSIIEEILTYDKDDFNLNIDMELVLSHVKDALDCIETALKNGLDEVELGDIINITNIPETYAWLLDYCLRKRGIDGTLTPNVKKIEGCYPPYYSLYIINYKFKRNKK